MAEHLFKVMPIKLYEELMQIYNQNKEKNVKQTPAETKPPKKHNQASSSLALFITELPKAERKQAQIVLEKLKTNVPELSWNDEGTFTGINKVSCNIIRFLQYCVGDLIPPSNEWATYKDLVRLAKIPTKKLSKLATLDHYSPN